MTARVLFVVNPGRQSRFYVMGLLRAAERLGVPHAAFEIGHVWQLIKSATDKAAAIRSIHADLARLVREQGISHAISYGYNGTFDLGLIQTERGPQSLFPHLGVRHILLWTDHPEWLSDGLALKSPIRELLADDRFVHIVKSDAAAGEVADVLRWPNVTWMPMAEDYELLQPALDVVPRHDVVAILGDARPIPQQLEPFLNETDPNPAAIDEIMRTVAVERLHAVAPESGSIVNAWLDAKRAEPLKSFWRLSRERGLDTSPLKGDAERWYAAVGALRMMVNWRRYFWIAWLTRRVDVGVYGSSAPGLGTAPAEVPATWVEYADQPRVYALGKVALNSNAAHDEEGMTHKPFQIAASQVPCVHHDTRGLSGCFAFGREVAAFQRGPDLLDTVRALIGNTAARRQMAEAMRARAMRDHAWEHRLSRMIAHDFAAVSVSSGHALAGA